MLLAMGVMLMACTAAKTELPLPFEVNSKITTAEGQRAAFIDTLETGTRDMPGNIAYTITKDADDAAVLWVAEVWEDEAAHKASLSLPSVQAAIAKGRPMIRGMERLD